MKNAVLKLYEAQIKDLKADTMVILYCDQIKEIYPDTDHMYLPAILRPCANGYFITKLSEILVWQLPQQTRQGPLPKHDHVYFSWHSFC